jgi:murein DD-endopeptidase MepM/ murein hydrolase activator NlpD
MLTKKLISLTQKTVYGLMIIGVIFSIFHPFQASAQSQTTNSTAPIPFLYLPFNGTWQVISSWFDHHSPNYKPYKAVLQSEKDCINNYISLPGNGEGEAIAVGPSLIFPRLQNIDGDPELEDTRTPHPSSNQVIAYGCPGCVDIEDKNVWYDGHPGYDFAIVSKTEVHAAGAGTIEYAGCNRTSGEGCFIKIVHDAPNEQYKSYYYHLYDPNTNGNVPWPGRTISGIGYIPKQGEHVNPGQIIAWSGNTGWKKDGASLGWGNHLHFEVRHNGIPVDPWGWTDFTRDPGNPDNDVLQCYNNTGEKSYNLFVDYEPHCFGCVLPNSALSETLKPVYNLNTTTMPVTTYLGGSLLDVDTPSSDMAAFISDITLPDGTVVSPGQSLTKTWRVKNSGTSTWTGYKLKFVDGNQMNGPTEINLPTTAPGETKDISINLLTPDSDGLNTGAWQITNINGTWVQGGKLWIKIFVQTGSSNIILTTDPPSPSEASMVRIHASIAPFATFRAMRIKIDGSVVYELGAPEFYYDWNTSGYTTGDHSVIVEVADQTDTSWSNPQRQGIVYKLLGNSVPVNHAPNRPTLIANPAYDWYVTIGSAPQLCSQAQGDSDGDAISQYRFVASGSPGTADSGWGNSSCYTFGSITPGTYEWHTQVKDSRGGISDWSDKWHFTVEPSGITATINSFNPGSPSNAEEVKIYGCTSGHAGVNITMRVLVNEANDGSDSGQWNIIKEQGSPCFNDIDVPIWRTLGYSDGQHRVRVVAWAIAPDAGAVYDQVYTLNHRRPDSPGLIAPVPLSQNIREPIYINSRTVSFKWGSAIRATSYVLHIGTNPSPSTDPNPVFRQTFNSSTYEYTVAFTQDYPTLYWQVEAINDVSSNFSGDQLFGIDRQAPTCSVQSPTPPVYESVFQVNWTGTDNLAGISSYTIQYKDSTRDTWVDWLGEVPSAKSYELFNGQPGHTYYFRCQAKDASGNTSIYPTEADTSVTIDPSSRPATPWWNPAFTQKRGITLLNNMPSLVLPLGYPVHLHFDSNTTPTAADLYNASTSTPKCNDIRVVYNDTTELNRLVQNCSSALIDIWFRTNAAIAGGGSNNASHQLYYGNASAGVPLADANQVWYPYKEGDTTNLYFFQEGSGATTVDSSGNNKNCSIGPAASWGGGKFGSGIQITQQPSGGIRSLVCGTVAPLNAFTVEFWINTSSDNDGRLIGALGGGGNGGPGNNWIIDFRGRLRLEVWPCSSCGSHGIESNFNLRDAPYRGRWNHVAVAFNGGNQVSFYINGTFDSAKTIPDQSGINTYSLPLEIGAVESGGQINVALDGVRISNGLKTNFPYGAFAQITNEPTSAAGNVVTPPATGSPDLVVSNVLAYPGIEGGMIVQVEVTNQGDLDTESGFYTDLYLNHLPAGAGDYTGSLRFWVNNPIPEGGTAILTTEIPSLPNLGPSTTSSINAITETSGTLYVQTDSMGIVAEENKQNNIYSDGLPVCIATADNFETDGTPVGASTISPGVSQTHNFNQLDDQDWIKFDAVLGQIYTISTSNLGLSSDTYLYLYGTDGVTLLASNDDFDNTLASQIEWQPTSSGTYYILVNHWNPNTSGCSTQYTISVNSVPVISIFADVPSSYWAWQYIERLYNNNITGGCSTNPLKYCPESKVTRAQMAVFLLKGMYGSDYVPPDGTGTIFLDIPADHMFGKWIEQLSVEGITGGCGNGNYCPDSPVTREQMAIFLLRAKHGNTYVPPAATGVFADVPADYWAASWIEQLAAEGITGGCGGGKYCPKGTVTRAQMAVFLVAAFNLP